MELKILEVEFDLALTGQNPSVELLVRGDLPRFDSWEIYVDSGTPVVGIGEVHLHIEDVELGCIIGDVRPLEIPVKQTHAALEFVVELLGKVHVILNVSGQKPRHSLFHALDGGLLQSDLHARVHVSLVSSLGLQVRLEVGERANTDNAQ